MEYIREGHTANLIGNSIYLFGGYYNYGYYQNDLHKYDVQSKTLQKTITSGIIPSVRCQHGSAVIEDNLFIFGGNANVAYSITSADEDNNLYSFNTISNEWLVIPIAESNGSLPQPRRCMSMFSFES